MQKNIRNNRKNKEQENDMIRYKIQLILLMLLLPMMTEAQKLTVESMTEAGNDISASQYRVLDIKGEPCALVKVQLAVAGATFQGNVIPPTDRKGSEYWVYMTHGSRELRIQHPSFLPLHINFADYGIEKLQPLVTYNLTLVIPHDNQNLQTQKLTINYSPADAMVLIDNKPHPGNGHIEEDLPIGEHEYLIASPGYVSNKGVVTLLALAPRTITEVLVKDETSMKQQQVKPQAIDNSLEPSRPSEEKEKVNRKSASGIGYRVQLYKGDNSRDSRKAAEKIGEEMHRLFPGEAVYIHFYSPNWVCRIGNYQTYTEARAILTKVKELGYNSATIMKGRIILPKSNN